SGSWDPSPKPQRGEDVRISLAGTSSWRRRFLPLALRSSGQGLWAASVKFLMAADGLRSDSVLLLAGYLPFILNADCGPAGPTRRRSPEKRSKPPRALPG